MTLGGFIRAYRETQGLSQRQFALRCKLSNAYISKLEAAEETGDAGFAPSMTAMRKIASAASLTLPELLDVLEGQAPFPGTIPTPGTLPSQVIGFTEDPARTILTAPEYAFLTAYRHADARAREDALLLLTAHL